MKKIKMSKIFDFFIFFYIMKSYYFLNIDIMMMWLIKLIQKRPSDRSIFIARISFWVLYIWVMYYNLMVLNKGIDNEYFFWNLVLNEMNVDIAKYIMISLWIIPVLMWVTNICLRKKKYVRIIQIIFGILLFYIAGSIQSSPNLDFDTLIWFMWLFPLTAGVTWKCITTKCLKYKETITKIRV